MYETNDERYEQPYCASEHAYKARGTTGTFDKIGALHRKHEGVESQAKHQDNGADEL
jgi:hypothetical protein